MKESEVTQQGLIAALTPTSTAPAAEQAYGHFNQPGKNHNNLVGQTITAQTYQSSGLSKSAETYVGDMMADKDGKKMATDAMKKIGDIDKDGRVDKKDLAAAIVAASLDGKGKFDNGVSEKDFAKLFDDKQLAAIREAAKGLAGTVESAGTGHGTAKATGQGQVAQR